MLNKPKYMTPSIHLDKCVIDINSDDLTFSCIVDGNEAITDWQIRIYRLDNNAIVFDTAQQTLKNHFYPVDEKNRNVVFKVNLKDYFSLDHENFVNSSTPYYWNVKFWGLSGTTTLSSEEVFYANSALSPTIYYSASNTDFSVLSEGTILNSRGYWFKASYNQPENISMKRYGWRIINTDSGEILVDTISKNQIYGVSSNISCYYNGFLGDGNYSIEVYIETQNGDILITPPLNITTAYSTSGLSNDFQVEVLPKESGVILNWGEAIIAGGRTEGDVSYASNYPVPKFNNVSIDIPNDARVVFDKGASSSLDVSEETYILISTQLINNENRTIFYTEGYSSEGNPISRKLMFADGSFYYVVINGDTFVERLYTPQYTPSKYVWYIIIMSPFLGSNGTETTLKVTESRIVNALYPSETTYPSEKTYPLYGTWDKLKEE